jgi:DNA helicase II / ATP-dependent DNA helicase PcrA
MYKAGAKESTYPRHESDAFTEGAPSARVCAGMLLTHHEARHKKYADGGLVQFLSEKIPKKVPYEVDTTTLNVSHRNSAEICALASRIYPELEASASCSCKNCRGADIEAAGLFIVRRGDYKRYVATYRPMQLRDKITSAGVEPQFPCMNFGQSKGLGFDRTIIVPTSDMLAWLTNSQQELKSATRAKFYVAVTRARHSVAIAADWKSEDPPPGFSIFK